MYKVLVVDDEVLVREAIGENVDWKSLDYELAGTCQDGREAMQFIKENPVDVVLTDICMPYVDGMELSEFIYNEFPDTHVLIFSGFDEFEYAKKAIKYDVEEYMLKPITAVELSEALARLKVKIDEKRAREEKYASLARNYNKNKILMVSKVLSDVITGKQTKEENRKEMLEYGIELKGSEYCIAILEIDMYSDLYEQNEENRQQASLMTFILHNISDELVQKKDAGYVCYGNENSVYILFSTNRPHEFKPTVYSVCEEISKQAKRVMKSTVTIGIGDYVRSISDINRSYAEAMDLISYRFLLGSGNIIVQEQIKGKAERKIMIEEEIEALKLAIKRKDEVVIIEVLRKLKENFRENYLTRVKVQMYLQQIMVEVQSVLKSSDMVEDLLYQERDRWMDEMIHERTLERAIQLLKQYCVQCAVRLDNRLNAGGKRYAMLAIDYIEKNYANTQLNLNSVCSYLGISTSRFSAIFKEATKATFMDVLIKTRMEKAMELLENTDLKNYEIAERVGFSDPHYFSLSFKKVTGMTPTEYTKQKR